MAKKDISLKAITEVLLNETEGLQKANKAITEIVPKALDVLNEVSRKIEILENTEVEVNPSAIERALKNTLVIPKWFQVAFVFVTILALLGFGFGLHWKHQKKAPFDAAKFQELEQDRAYLLKYANYMSEKNPKTHKEFLEENALPESLAK